MKKLLLFTLVVTGFVIPAFSQDDHDHEGHHHDHKNELGLATMPVYFFKEQEFTYGLHLHITHQIKETRYGYGIGYERIFDEHEHHTFSAVGSYRPIDPLMIIVAPGITFEGAAEEQEMMFAVHLESSYEFEVGDFHIGPVIEWAYDPEDYHFSLGVHFGYLF